MVWQMSKDGAISLWRMSKDDAISLWRMSKDGAIILLANVEKTVPLPLTISRDDRAQTVDRFWWPGFHLAIGDWKVPMPYSLGRHRSRNVLITLKSDCSLVPLQFDEVTALPTPSSSHSEQLPFRSDQTLRHDDDRGG